MPFDDLLPAGLIRDRVRARIGLLSDTHLPTRLRSLPATLPTIFAGADMILHAGDVGSLSVLDSLSAIAPVLAVHGNDDSEEAARELPEQLVIGAGLRILLWHSHFPNYTEEMASRRSAAISVARIVARARRAGAQIAVFGHWHIPLVTQEGSILVINPGALAPPNLFSRQINRTVAQLWIDEQAQPHVVHVDVSRPDSPFPAGIDWTAGFRAADHRHTATLLTPDLAALVAAARMTLTQAEQRALLPVFTPLAWQAWDGQALRICLADFRAALAQSRLDPALIARLRDLMERAHSSP